MSDQGRRYDSIELIFRNAGKVDEFADLNATNAQGNTPANVAKALRLVAECEEAERVTN